MTSAGSQAVAALMRLVGPSALARRLRMTPRGLRYLATGERVPGSDTRRRLADLGVAPNLWGTTSSSPAALLELAEVVTKLSPGALGRILDLARRELGA